MQILRTKTETRRVAYRSVVDVEDCQPMHFDGEVRLLGRGKDGYTYAVWLDLDEIQKILDTKAT